jgi:transcriptional regulator with XRE-family HTH domain
MKDDQNIMMAALGKRIQSIRRSKGFTQQKLGERTEINYKHIGEIERGRQNPSLALVQKIAEGLDVELIDLFLFEHATASREKNIKKIIKILKDLPDEKLSQILFIFKSLFLTK